MQWWSWFYTWSIRYFRIYLLWRNNNNDWVSQYRKHSLSAFFLPFNHNMAFLPQRILLKSNSTTITNRGVSLKSFNLSYLYMCTVEIHGILYQFIKKKIIYKITLSDLIISHIFNTVWNIKLFRTYVPQFYFDFSDFYH